MVPHALFASAGSQGRAAAPIDLPDEVDARIPEFKSRRGAEALPPLRPAVQSNALDLTWCRRLARADWMAGFRWGVLAAVGGFCLFAVVAAEVLK